jgi:hypothetical protein
MPQNSWPKDIDGDVLRRLSDKKFDFSKDYAIDFNVEFDEWPPSESALKTLRVDYPNARLYVDEESGSGSVVFQVNGQISYELVTGVQARVTSLMTPFGGTCDSWGVLH